MSNIYPVEQKMVPFNGADLLGVKANDGKVYVGVRWVCDGIGLREGQRNNQLTKIKTDLVLKQGVRKFILPTKSGEQEVTVIELDFLPLWIAKISPNTVEGEVQANLIQYQLKAKDVLAAAFIHNKPSYMLEDPIERAERWIEEAKEKKYLTTQLEEQKPLVTFVEICMQSDESIKVRDLAHSLSSHGLKIGQNGLFDKLRDWKLICQNSTEPTQRAVEQGLFEIATGVKRKPNGIPFTWRTPYVTVKGQVYVADRLKKERGA